MSWQWIELTVMSVLCQAAQTRKQQHCQAGAYVSLPADGCDKLYVQRICARCSTVPLHTRYALATYMFKVLTIAIAGVLKFFTLYMQPCVHKPYVAEDTEHGT